MGCSVQSRVDSSRYTPILYPPTRLCRCVRFFFAVGIAFHTRVEGLEVGRSEGIDKAVKVHIERYAVSTAGTRYAAMYEGGQLFHITAHLADIMPRFTLELNHRTEGDSARILLAIDGDFIYNHALGFEVVEVVGEGEAAGAEMGAVPVTFASVRVWVIVASTTAPVLSKVSENLESSPA